MIYSEDLKNKLEALAAGLSARQEILLQTPLADMKDEIYLQFEDLAFTAIRVAKLLKCNSRSESDAAVRQQCLAELREYHQKRKTDQIGYLLQLFNSPEYLSTATSLYSGISKLLGSSFEYLKSFAGKKEPGFKPGSKKVPLEKDALQQKSIQIRTKYEKEFIKLLNTRKKTPPYEVKKFMESLLQNNAQHKYISDELEDIIRYLFSEEENDVEIGVNQLQSYIHGHEIENIETAALHLWGMICEHGIAFDKDEEYAILFYKLAAERHYTAAKTSLAALLETAPNIPKHKVYSLYWEAATEGCPKAAFKLAEFFLNPDQGNNSSLGIKFIKQSIIGCYIPALFSLSKYTAVGISGVKQDVPTSSALLMFATELDFPEAVRTTAQALKDGKKAEMSEATMEKPSTLLRAMSIADRNPEDFITIAWYLENGWGAPKKDLEGAAVLREFGAFLKAELDKKPEPDPFVSKNTKIMMLIAEGQKHLKHKTYLQALRCFFSASNLEVDAFDAANRSLASVLYHELVKQIHAKPYKPLPPQKALAKAKGDPKSHPIPKEALEHFFILKQEIFTSLLSPEKDEKLSIILILINKLLNAEASDRNDSITALEQYCIQSDIPSTFRVRIYCLGLFQVYGLTSKRNLAEGYKLIQKAADLNLGVAHNFLGSFFMQTPVLAPSGKKENTSAISAFRMADKCHSLAGKINHALLVEAGIGTPADVKQSFRLLSEAYELGSSLAKAYLAKYYFFGLGGATRDVWLGNRLYEEAYRAGVFWAREKQADMQKLLKESSKQLFSSKEIYYDVRIILQRLVKHYEKNVKLKDIINDLLNSDDLSAVYRTLQDHCMTATITDRDALSLLGLCYQEALGVEEDLELARICHKLAMPLPLSCYYLGREELESPDILQRTLGIKRLDSIKMGALPEYRLPIPEQIPLLFEMPYFMPEAYCLLGDYFCNQKTESDDFKKLGLSYYETAARLFHPDAFTCIGKYHEKINDSEIVAVTCYERGIKFGSPLAKLLLIELRLNQETTDFGSIHHEYCGKIITLIDELALEAPKIIPPKIYDFAANYYRMSGSLKDLLKSIQYSENALKASEQNKVIYSRKQEVDNIEFHLKLGKEFETGTNHGIKNPLLALKHYHLAFESEKRHFKKEREEAKAFFDALFIQCKQGLDNVKKPRARIAVKAVHNTDKSKLAAILHPVAELANKNHALGSIAIERVLNILMDYLLSLNIEFEDTGGFSLLLKPKNSGTKKHSVPEKTTESALKVRLSLNKEDIQKLIDKIFLHEKNNESLQSKNNKRIYEALKSLLPETKTPKQKDQDSAQSASAPNKKLTEEARIRKLLQEVSNINKNLKKLKLTIEQSQTEIAELSISAKIQDYQDQIEPWMPREAAMLLKRENCLEACKRQKEEALAIESLSANILKPHIEVFNAFTALEKNLETDSNKPESELKQTKNDLKAFQDKIQHLSDAITAKRETLLKIDSSISARFEKLSALMKSSKSAATQNRDDESNEETNIDGIQSLPLNIPQIDASVRELARAEKKRKWEEERPARQAAFQAKQQAEHLHAESLKRERKWQKLAETQGDLSWDFASKKKPSPLIVPLSADTVGGITQMVLQADELALLHKVVKQSILKPDPDKTWEDYLIERLAFLGTIGQIAEVMRDEFFSSNKELKDIYTRIRDAIFHDDDLVPPLSTARELNDAEKKRNNAIRATAINFIIYLEKIRANKTKAAKTQKELENELCVKPINPNDFYLALTKARKVLKPPVDLEDRTKNILIKRAHAQISLGKIELEACFSKMTDANGDESYLKVIELAQRFAETRIGTNLAVLRDAQPSQLKMYKVPGILPESVEWFLKTAIEFRHPQSKPAGITPISDESGPLHEVGTRRKPKSEPKRRVFS